MNKKRFYLYTDYKKHLSLLSLEQKGQLMDAIFAHAEGEDVELTGVVEMAFSFIAAQMDRDNENYEIICEKRRESGAKGGLAKASKAKQKLAKASKSSKSKDIDIDIDKDIDIEKDKDKDIDKKRKKTTLSLYQELKSDYPLSDNMELTLSDWFTYRDNIKKPLGEKSVIQLIEKTIELERQHGYQAVKKCFDNSMENGYQGVFFDKIGTAKVTPIRDNKSEVDEFFRRELGI